jgi:hypothetical protein
VSHERRLRKLETAAGPAPEPRGEFPSEGEFLAAFRRLSIAEKVALLRRGAWAPEDFRRLAQAGRAGP